MKKSLHTREQITLDFQNLLQRYKRKTSEIVTKEQALQLEQEKLLLESVAQYTPTSIVQGLADLQLKFSSSIETLSEEIHLEVNKLEELKQSIGIQKSELQNCIDANIAANMLYILQKEQEKEKETLEQEAKEKIEQHNKTVISYRTRWEKDQENFEQEQKEYKEQLAKTRTKELEEYRYQLERTYKIDEDQYEHDKELLIRYLADTEQQKIKDWTQREKLLEEKASDLEKYKQKVDNFDEEFKTKTDEARKKAIDKANKEAKEAAALYEKEVEGTKLVNDLEISSLETTIAEQKEQIGQLTIDLKEALDKVANLSIKALENSSVRLN